MCNESFEQFEEFEPFISVHGKTQKAQCLNTPCGNTLNISKEPDIELFFYLFHCNHVHPTDISSGI